MAQKLVVDPTRPSSILTRTGGFLADYTHTLNPYVGCAYACSFCYVRRLPVAMFHGGEWGSWVDVKTTAAEVLTRQLRTERRRGPVVVFMSSSTDPYQPVERDAHVTRDVLRVFVEQPPDFLMVQTRGPLVCRDIDLLTELGNRVAVSITVETDLDEVRRRFTPGAPSVSARLRALGRLTDAGLATQAALAPVLPSSPAFARALREVTDRVCVDTYVTGDGSSGKRTAQLGVHRHYADGEDVEWASPGTLPRVVGALCEHFPPDRVFVSQAGFAPFGKDGKPVRTVGSA